MEIKGNIGDSDNALNLILKKFFCWLLIDKNGKIIDWCEKFKEKYKDNSYTNIIDILNPSDVDSFFKILKNSINNKIQISFKVKNGYETWKTEFYILKNEYLLVFKEKIEEESEENKIKDDTNIFDSLKNEIIQKNDEIEQLRSEVRRLKTELYGHLRNTKLLEEKIIQHEMSVRFALNAVDDGIWDWKPPTGELYFSDRFFAMLDYDPFEMNITFDTFYSLVHSDDRGMLIEKIRQLKEGETNQMSLEYRMQKKDGTYAWILSRASAIEVNDEGKALRIVGTHVDITKSKTLEIQLKQREAELSRKNEEYRQVNQQLLESVKKNNVLIKQLQDKQAYINSIIEAVPAAIGLISDRIILFVNKYACLMSGYDYDEIVGQDTKILYPTESEYLRVSKLIYETNGSKDGDDSSIKNIVTVWKMKNGTLIDVFISLCKVESDVLPNSYTVVAVDITSQRLYEDELIKAKEQAEQAEFLKTRFLCNISHELRTPANGIVGFAELLLKNQNPAKQEKYIKIILNSSQQLVRIISDIIDISKIETGDVEIFESEANIKKIFNELYEQYFNILVARNKINIKLGYDFQYPEKQGIIITDNEKLKHILNNLINNAIKFTDRGEIKFGVTIKDNILEFYVKDTGIGIEEDEQESIFSAFRQTLAPKRKLYGGNGLGLAISKGLLKYMGGNIWLTSQKDVGTTVYFTIPYKPKYADNNNYDNMKKWGNFKLLIVEDDVTAAKLIESALEDTGIKLSHATTGLEALRIFRKDPKFDIIIMDMRLPEMDGYETTRRIKEIRPDIPIIAQTAYAFSEDRNKCLKAGCDEYMTKPIIESELIMMLERFLEKKGD